MSSSAKRRFSATSKPRDKGAEQQKDYPTPSGETTTMAPSTSSADGKASEEAEEAQQKRMERRRMMAERWERI